MLNIIDEFTHECLAIRIDRRLKAIDVIDVLSDLFILRGVPRHIRSDGTEFVAKAVQAWIGAVGAKTATSRPAVPGRTASSCRSMPGCATSCSTAKSSTLSPRRRSLSRAGGGTSTLCAHIAPSDANRRLRRSSSPPWPRWRPGQPSTTNHIGPLGGGGSVRSTEPALFRSR